jgi:flavin-dependent dehydrogenase
MVLVGAALPPRKDVAKNFEALKQGLARHGLQLGKTIAREGAVIGRPVSLNQVYTGAGGVALLGEAAGWISPSSAEGISYAFKSAHCMSEALKDGLTGFNARYARNTRKMSLNIVLKNLKSPFMYNPLLRKAILRSGIKSVKVVGPSLHQRLSKNVILTNSTPKQNK